MLTPAISPTAPLPKNEVITLDKKQIDSSVEKEIARLKAIFKDIPPNDKTLVEGLIVQAARLRISLNIMWEDISINGDTESFTQSEKLTPYERERPVARLFNNRDKNYQTIIKILTDRLPDNKGVAEKKAGDELLAFIAAGKR